LGPSNPTDPTGPFDFTKMGGDGQASPYCGLCVAVTILVEARSAPATANCGTQRVHGGTP